MLFAPVSFCTCVLACSTLLITASSTESADSAGIPYELGLLPVVAYDSSTGLGFGVISNLAHFKDGIRPYDWRLRLQAYTTVQEGPDGESEYSVQHHYLKLDMPQLLTKRLRGIALARYRRRANAGYFGLGNDSKSITPAQSDTEASFRYHQYDIQYGELSFDLRYKLNAKFDGFGGIKSWLADVSSYPNSLLSQAGSQQDLLGLNRHGVGRLSAGILYDSRDKETAPTLGMFHEISVRGAKNISIDGAYAGVNITGRAYYSLFKEYAVLAGRLMFDGLFGETPLYVLARHGGLEEGLALGDNRSVRGIPNGRYHGKIKTMANLELRSKLFHYKLFGTRNSVGILGFVDAGRVWADWKSQADLDGAGLGLKYGVGGGLRLQFGRTFIVRTDTAWSTDGRGLYVNVNHIF
jgi:outer membrane protein assembly factor BamA